MQKLPPVYAAALVVAVIGIVVSVAYMAQDEPEPPIEMTIPYTITEVRQVFTPEGYTWWQAIYSFDITGVPMGTGFSNGPEYVPYIITETTGNPLVWSAHAHTEHALYHMTWTFTHDGYIFHTQEVARLI
jgi:hypothetical protein